jgi:hypothetical protein
MKWLILVLSLALMSCLENGGGDVSIGTASSGSPAAASMTVTKIQGKTKELWLVDSDGKIYSSSASMSIEGKCSRGVGRISVLVNGSVDSAEASCSSGGTFSWIKYFPGSSNATGNEYRFELQGLRSDGVAISGLVTSKVIVIDTRAPAAPTLNSPSGCRLVTGVWTCSDSQVRISGGWSDLEGVVSLQYPSGGTISYPTSKTFAYDFVLSEGQSRTVTFTVKDKVGNISGTSTQTVSYISATNLLAGSLTSGGTTGFSGGPINSAASMIGNLDSMSGRTSDQGIQLQSGPIAVGSGNLNP